MVEISFSSPRAPVIVCFGTNDLLLRLDNGMEEKANQN
jgi:hypothetical protein